MDDLERRDTVETSRDAVGTRMDALERARKALEHTFVAAVRASRLDLDCIDSILHATDATGGSFRGRKPHAKRSPFLWRTIIPLVVVPSVALSVYAGLALLPSDWLGDGTPSELGMLEFSNASGVAICPRSSICSEGGLEIAFFALSRLSAFILYVPMCLCFWTGCHTLLTKLRGTVLSVFIPLERFQTDLHFLMGRLFLVCSAMHTVGHIIRWALRKELPGKRRLVRTTPLQIRKSTRTPMHALMLPCLWPVVHSAGALSSRVHRDHRHHQPRFNRGRSLETQCMAEMVVGAAHEHALLVHRHGWRVYAARDPRISWCISPACDDAGVHRRMVPRQGLHAALPYTSSRVNPLHSPQRWYHRCIQLEWKAESLPASFRDVSEQSYVRIMVPWLPRGGWQMHPFSLYTSLDNDDDSQDIESNSLIDAGVDEGNTDLALSACLAASLKELEASAISTSSPLRDKSRNAILRMQPKQNALWGRTLGTIRQHSVFMSDPKVDSDEALLNVHKGFSAVAGEQNSVASGEPISPRWSRMCRNTSRTLGWELRG